MKRLVFIFFFMGSAFALVAQPTCCDHTIILTDDYGDGWNGGYLDVYVNGSPVMTNLTLASGMTTSAVFSACSGDDIDVYYTQGGWPYENYYAIYDGQGTRLGESGSGGTIPVSLSDLTAYCPETPPDCCNHTIILTDDYGDSWNGGYLDVYVGGFPFATGITLASGAGPEYYTFSVCTGATIDIYYTPGGWPYENYYAIYDGLGTRQGESGSGGTTPVDLLGITAYCPPTSPEYCDHTILLTDDYGDGWNGGYLDVHVGGVLVATGITLASGAGPEYFTFPAWTGVTIDIFYSEGAWPYENYYALYDAGGARLGESGFGGVQPEDLTNSTGNCPPAPPECCDHQICLTDDYGDGWNGSYIDIYVGGVPVATGITLASGSGPECYTFSACEGAPIDIIYTAGSWPHENYFIVYDGEGQVLGESGTGGITPTNLRGLTANCTPPPPVCCDHFIYLEDDTGDGWNGGSADVHVDGSPVLTGITITDGFENWYTFTACSGADIDVYYTAGTSPEENSYYVVDGFTTTIGQSGSGGTIPEDLLDLEGACQPPEPLCCDHTICLSDDYGDGWNGGSVDVYVNGSHILGGLTLASGYGPECYTFSACEGADIDVLYTSGEWAYENSFTVYDGKGDMLGESGSGGTTPEDLIDLVGFCPEEAPVCCEHTVWLWDDYGDGWNGGSVDVYVGDIPVLTDLTLPSGGGPAIYYFTACTGSEIDVLYTAGTWSYENYYCVYDGMGVSIGESGNGGTTPSSLLDLPGYCEPPVVPENDLCADALPLDCNTSVSGTTTGATLDDVGFCGTSNTAPGVWYSFVATSSLTTLSTCNQADFDTKITVFTGTCNELICIGGQDDAQGCANYTTSLDVTTVPGESYLVLIHGYGTATGNFTLTLTCPCEIIVPPQPPFENMTGNTLSVADATYLVGWSCDNPGWEITSDATLPTIEYTAGTGSADFTVTYDNGTTIWTCRVTITSIPSWEKCTMTQGFYGNETGVYCDGRTTTELLEDLLFTDLVIAGPVNWLLLNSDDASCIIERLPGSGASVPISEPSTCDDPDGIALHKKPPKRFKNALVGQTITLGLNLRLSDMGEMVMTTRFLTTASSSGCGTYTSPNYPVNDDWRYNEIPESVYNYLGTDPTINDLYDLANDALEGDPVGGLSLEDIAYALGAVNDGFDGCMFGTFESVYWPPQENQAAVNMEDSDEIAGIKHTIYPNPFDGTTNIEFTLPSSSEVKVEVFNINGERLDILLERLVDKDVTTKVEFNAGHLPQGMYIYVIHTNMGSFYGKMVKQY